MSVPDPCTAGLPDDVQRDGAARSQWLGIAEAADHLGVSVGAVKRWRRLGMFAPAVMLGARRPRWKAADLDRWAESRRERLRTTRVYDGPGTSPKGTT